MVDDATRSITMATLTFLGAAIAYAVIGEVTLRALILALVMGVTVGVLTYTAGDWFLRTAN